MEIDVDDDDQWGSLIWITDFAWFCYLNRGVVRKWPPVYILSLYFILSNLYNIYLREIREFAIVNYDIFATFFGSSLLGGAALSSTDAGHSLPIDIPNGIKYLLSHDNYMLNTSQKRIIQDLMINGSPDAQPGFINLHLYVGKIDDRYHLVQCSCCASDIADVFVDLLETYERFQRHPDFKIAPRGTLPSVVRHIVANVPCIFDIPDEEVVPIPLTNTLRGVRTLLTSGIIHERSPRDRYQKVVVASATLLLYILMPHHYAVKHLGRLIRRSDNQGLIVLTSILDRLLCNFPKEGDVWSLKLYTSRQFLKRFRRKGGNIFSSIKDLFSTGSMDLEPLLLEVSSKSRMNGRLSWYLWHLYTSVRDISLRHLSKGNSHRVLEQIDRYFMGLYSVMLVANEGYQGIFYIYLYIARNYSGSLRDLREICERAVPNASWEANLAILDKYM
ncbi:putative integral membrane protein [Babesia bovis T2Bo]|uniref:Uncharacterized protein n=1 Tax=Babesia bovis TaxID=5865 RepID=A7AWB7_BABBO|nr:putative integral membrane protein [Babesia bovis T2Bo]EDO05345.1 putative integral membrane protein [Babesia bovis T2Bo]|eukprot:XP_001608913.1 hypothetical protein [Babesia bovis T2Bo]